MRDGEGQWRKFPFWYTVLALNEMDLPEALNELRYAGPRLELAAARTRASTTYAARRHEIATRVLRRI
jgi:hypothetical protein